MVLGTMCQGELQMGWLVPLLTLRSKSNKKLERMASKETKRSKWLMGWDECPPLHQARRLGTQIYIFHFQSLCPHHFFSLKIPPPAQSEPSRP